MSNNISIIFNTVVIDGNEYVINEIFYDSIKRNTISNYETIAIVRNKANVEKYSKLFDKVIYVENALGYGLAMNEGAKIAKSDYLVFCNNDIIFSHGWDAPLIKEIDRDLVVACPDSRIIENVPCPYKKFIEFDTIYEKLDTCEFKDISEELNVLHNRFDKFISNVQYDRRIGFAGDCLIRLS